MPSVDFLQDHGREGRHALLFPGGNPRVEGLRRHQERRSQAGPPGDIAARHARQVDTSPSKVRGTALLIHARSWTPKGLFTISFIRRIWRCCVWTWQAESKMQPANYIAGWHSILSEGCSILHYGQNSCLQFVCDW